MCRRFKLSNLKHLASFTRIRNLRQLFIVQRSGFSSSIRAHRLLHNGFNRKLTYFSYYDKDTEKEYYNVRKDRFYVSKKDKKTKKNSLPDDYENPFPMTKEFYDFYLRDQFLKMASEITLDISSSDKDIFNQLDKNKTNSYLRSMCLLVQKIHHNNVNKEFIKLCLNVYMYGVMLNRHYLEYDITKVLYCAIDRPAEYCKYIKDIKYYSFNEHFKLPGFLYPDDYYKEIETLKSQGFYPELDIDEWNYNRYMNEGSLLHVVAEDKEEDWEVGKQPVSTDINYLKKFELSLRQIIREAWKKCHKPLSFPDFSFIKKKKSFKYNVTGSRFLSDVLKSSKDKPVEDRFIFKLTKVLVGPANTRYCYINDIYTRYILSLTNHKLRTLMKWIPGTGISDDINTLAKKMFRKKNAIFFEIDLKKNGISIPTVLIDIATKVLLEETEDPTFYNYYNFRKKWLVRNHTQMCPEENPDRSLGLGNSNEMESLVHKGIANALGFDHCLLNDDIVYEIAVKENLTLSDKDEINKAVSVIFDFYKKTGNLVHLKKLLVARGFRFCERYQIPWCNYKDKYNTSKDTIISKIMVNILTERFDHVAKTMLNSKLVTYLRSEREVLYWLRLQIWGCEFEDETSMPENCGGVCLDTYSTLNYNLVKAETLTGKNLMTLSKISSIKTNPIKRGNNESITYLLKLGKLEKETTFPDDYYLFRELNKEKQEIDVEEFTKTFYTYDPMLNYKNNCRIRRERQDLYKRSCLDYEKYGSQIDTYFTYNYNRREALPLSMIYSSFRNKIKISLKDWIPPMYGEELKFIEDSQSSGRLSNGYLSNIDYSTNHLNVSTYFFYEGDVEDKRGCINRFCNASQWKEAQIRLKIRFYKNYSDDTINIMRKRNWFMHLFLTHRPIPKTIPIHIRNGIATIQKPSKRVFGKTNKVILEKAKKDFMSIAIEDSLIDSVEELLTDLGLNEELKKRNQPLEVVFTSKDSLDVNIIEGKLPYYLTIDSDGEIKSIASEFVVNTEEVEEIILDKTGNDLFDNAPTVDITEEQEDVDLEELEKYQDYEDGNNGGFENENEVNDEDFEVPDFDD